MKSVLLFLSDLKQNNTREWFQDNKKRYDETRQEFDTFINEVIAGIYKFDPSIGMLSAKDCVFRIYRDVRFSADKSPYKTNMGGAISKGGRKSDFAGYYFHLDPEETFIAGGKYMPQADVLKKLRQEVMYNMDEFSRILNKPSFKKTFGEMEGEKLKKPPKDFPPDFPEIELLKFKSYTVFHKCNITDVTGKDFVNYTVDTFKEMFPFIRFLNRVFE
ncbi:MAG: DUF2461 domain-containing protein [Bacteroidales bacterium]|nr:DUF2461 domain-containing protein [Bacteroidales bacterium]MCF8405221.1 DUF2461 domain-containing protein [Bacteroidales bacterium]